jgi:protein ImuB
MENNGAVQQVCSLNQQAIAAGLARGMTKVEVDMFPAAIALTRSNQTEIATREGLLRAAGAFSHRVEDRSEGHTFLCVMDIAGTEKLFGSSEELAHSVLDRVRALNIKASVTVSENFYAAVSLAKSMGTDSHIGIIPAGREGEVMANLPLTVLDLTDEQAEVFSLWGIRNLGALAALPERDLIARIGQEGRRIHLLASGKMHHSFQPAEPDFRLEEHMVLDSSVEILDALLFVMSVMLEQLILRASARALALASVDISLMLEGGATHTCIVRPSLPSNDKQIWIRLIHLELEAHPPPAAIVAVKLIGEPGTTRNAQLGLFSPQLPESSRLDVTLARLRALLGESNVGCAVLDDTHQPGEFHITPFTPSADGTASTPTGHTLAALRMLRPAEDIFVTFQDERPSTIVFRHKVYKVEASYGPWRFSGSWWNSSEWNLEQWDLIARAQDNCVMCCRTMRDIALNNWQMAAFYD